MALTPWDFLAAGGASLAAGAINALAGGGTLVSFPTLTAIGVPAIAANVTNTVALCPGYLAGTYAQRDDLAGCLDSLWRETLEGKRRFKLYRQLKMYNDPSLNPAVYRKLGEEPGL